MLQDIYLPNVISILDNAFQNCTELSTISLGDNLETIGSEAFSYCSKLESLIIPGNVTNFGTSMLTGCSSLKELIFEESVKPLSFPAGSYDGATGIQKKEINGMTIQFKIQYYKPFFNYLPIEKLYIGRNLSDSPRYTISGYGDVDRYLITSYDTPFSNLPNLRELTIGENVSTLGPNEALIYEVDLYVSPGAFKNCDSLKEVTVQNSTPPTGAEFSNTAYSNARLIVPDNTVSLYQSAEGWKKFLDIIDHSSSGVEAVYNNGKDRNISINPEGLLYMGESKEYIYIYGINGKLLYSGDVEPNQSISLANGFYILRIKNDSIKIKI